METSKAGFLPHLGGKLKPQTKWCWSRSPPDEARMEANRAGSLPHLSNKETKKMEYWPGRDLSHGHWPLAVCRQRGKETETKKIRWQRINHTDTCQQLFPEQNCRQRGRKYRKAGRSLSVGFGSTGGEYIKELCNVSWSDMIHQYDSLSG